MCGCFALRFLPIREADAHETYAAQQWRSCHCENLNCIVAPGGVALPQCGSMRLTIDVFWAAAALLSIFGGCCAPRRAHAGKRTRATSALRPLSQRRTLVRTPLGAWRTFMLLGDRPAACLSANKVRRLQTSVPRTSHRMCGIQQRSTQAATKTAHRGFAAANTWFGGGTDHAMQSRWACHASDPLRQLQWTGDSVPAEALPPQSGRCTADSLLGLAQGDLDPALFGAADDPCALLFVAAILALVLCARNTRCRAPNPGHSVCQVAVCSAARHVR